MMVKGLEAIQYKEQLRSFGFHSLEGKRLRGDLFAVYNILLRGRGGTETDLCSEK